MPYRPTFKRKKAAFSLALQLAGFGLIALPLVYSSALNAQTEAETQQTKQQIQYNIPAGKLAEVLNRFAEASGVYLSGHGDLTQDNNSKGLDGQYSVEQALQLLLDGTGLSYRFTDGNTLTLVSAETVDNALLLEPIQVTGTYTTKSINNATGLDMSLRETPQSVAIITRQQMDDRAVTTVAGMLQHTTGISINQVETDRVFPTARGFEIENIQIDGMLAGDLAAGGSFQSDFLADTAIYERIEIIRGAAGMLVGAGSPSASINLVRKRPTDEFSASVAVKAGSWNLGRVEADVSSPLGFDGKLRGRLVAAHQQNESYMDHLKQEVNVLYGVIEADITPDTLFTFGIDHQEHRSDGMTWGDPVPLFYADGGRTDLPRSTTTGTDWTYRNRDTTTAFASLEHYFNNDWSAKIAASHLNGSFDDERLFVRGFLDRVTGEGLSAFPVKRAADREQNSIDLRVSGPFSLLDREHELVLGWNSSYDKINHKGWLNLTTPSTGNFFEWDYPHPGFEPTVSGRSSDKIEQSGVYASSRFSITDPLSVIVGARSSSWSFSDSNDFGGDTIDESDSGIVTPYVGVVYDINKTVSVYASYTNIFRFQTEKDVNNNLIDPLTGVNKELGIKAELFDKGLNVSFAVFDVLQDNLAVEDREIIVNGLPEMRYKTEKGVRTKGYEFEVSGAVTPNLQVYAGYTHRKAENNAGEEVTRRAPRDMLRLSGSYDLSNRVNGLTVGGALRWQSEIFPRRDGTVGPDGNQATQPSYYVTDLFARYQVTPKLSASLNIDNIFDETYFTSVGYFGFGFYGKPRSVSASLKYDF